MGPAPRLLSDPTLRPPACPVRPPERLPECPARQRGRLPGVRSPPVAPPRPGPLLRHPAPGRRCREPPVARPSGGPQPSATARTLYSRRVSLFLDLIGLQALLLGLEAFEHLRHQHGVGLFLQVTAAHQLLRHFLGGPLPHSRLAKRPSATPASRS